MLAVLWNSRTPVPATTGWTHTCTWSTRPCRVRLAESRPHPYIRTSPLGARFSSARLRAPESRPAAPGCMESGVHARGANPEPLSRHGTWAGPKCATGQAIFLAIVDSHRQAGARKDRSCQPSAPAPWSSPTSNPRPDRGRPPVLSVTTAPPQASPVRAFAGVGLRLLDPLIHMDQMGDVDYVRGNLTAVLVLVFVLARAGPRRTEIAIPRSGSAPSSSEATAWTYTACAPPTETVEST
jgi:hypothetical protein